MGGEGGEKHSHENGLLSSKMKKNKDVVERKIQGWAFRTGVEIKMIRCDGAAVKRARREWWRKKM